MSSLGLSLLEREIEAMETCQHSKVFHQIEEWYYDGGPREVRVTYCKFCKEQLRFGPTISVPTPKISVQKKLETEITQEGKGL